MIRISRKLALMAAAVSAVSGIGTGINFAADNPITSFTPGDIVVLRGGDSANPNTATTTSQVSLYLDEYTVAGGYVGTMDVPSSGGSALTLPGIGDFQHDGVLSLSTNGQYLTFAGYQTAVGTSDAFAQTLSSQYQPVIGIIGNSLSSLNTTTVVNSYNNGSQNPYIRGAVTNDGTSFWAFGKFAASGATSNGGLSYVSGTGPTATTTTVEGFGDWRDITIANGQLYGGTGSSSVGNHAPYIINNTYAGVITSPTQPTTNLGSSMALNTQMGTYVQSASALALVDVSDDANTQNGVNVMYTLSDQSTSGIIKYYWNGSDWINPSAVVALNATNGANPTGLIAAVDPSNSAWVDITVTGTNGIYTYVDKNGFNTAIPANSFSLVAQPATGEAFYGVALAPTAPVPEPASLGLLAVAGAGVLLRRRR